MQRHAGAQPWMRKVDFNHRLDPPRSRLQHHHSISQVSRLLGIVRHQQCGDARTFADGQQLILQLLAGQCIERTEWLVQQQNPRACHQPPGNRHTLRHASGKLVRVRRFKAYQAYQQHELMHTAGTFALGELGQARALPVLQAAEADSDPEVRKAVRIALAQLRGAA